MTETIGLMGAVERDDQRKLKQLLSSSKNKQSISQLAKCLHMASLWGHQECVDILLEAGAMVNIHDINGNTPLIVAVRQDHVDIVEKLIEAKCNVNKATHLAHATPLHFAVSNGSLGCTHLLIEAGANVEARTSSGRTPLMLACRSGHEHAVLLLLEAGAKVDKTDNDRAVALHFAAEENNLDCLQHLLNAGANAGLVTKYSDSALGLAARRGNIEAMGLLLSQEIKSSSPRRYNLSPLHWACESGHFDCVQLLLSGRSFDVNTEAKQPYSRGDFTASKGITPLMLASRGGYCSVIDLLIKNDAEVDKMDCDGMTALLYATKNGHSKCVERLLFAKANVNGISVMPGSLAISPLLTAISNRNLSVLKILLRANCAINTAGLLRVEGESWLPILLASQQQEDVLQMLQLFAIAECQNPDFVQYSYSLMEANCLDSNLLRDLVLRMTVSSVLPLSFICRHKIRCQVGERLFYQVSLLPIPTPLQRFLLLSELEE